MGREIERKYLVDISRWDPGDWKRQDIVQGYLMTDSRGVLRVRRIDGQGILSLKMKVSGSSRSREEFEYDIPAQDTEQLLQLCTKGVSKVRHHVEHAGKVWHVDVFRGGLAGIVVAEIELEGEDETFVTPDFVDREVTDDPRYSNAAMAQPGFLEDIHARPETRQEDTRK